MMISESKILMGPSNRVDRRCQQAVCFDLPLALSGLRME